MVTIALVFASIALFSASISSGARDSVLPRTSGPELRQLDARKIVAVAFGQQIQTTTESNYWIVWEEGMNACENMQSLAPLDESPCNITFRLPNVSERLMLGDCDGNNSPHALLLVDGEYDRGCTALSRQHKIHCHGYLHDIIKHGYCK